MTVGGMVPPTVWGRVELPPDRAPTGEPPQRVACWRCLVDAKMAVAPQHDYVPQQTDGIPDVVVMVNGTSYCPRHAVTAR